MSDKKIRRYAWIALIVAIALGVWGEVSRVIARSDLVKQNADAAIPTVTTTTAPNSATQSLNSLGLFAGTGHQYSITQSVIARLDFTTAFYRAPLNNTGAQTWYPNYNIEIGFGLRL